MPTKQIIAYGALVERSIDGEDNWEAIPACKGIAIPMVETAYEDATSLDGDDGFREWIPGMKDGGVLSVPCGYTADGYEQQIADNALGDPIFYRTTLKKARGQETGDVFEFRGFPTPQPQGNDLGQIVSMTVNIRTTGGVTWTRGTPVTPPEPEVP